MKRALIAVAALSLISIAGFSVWAYSGSRSASCSKAESCCSAAPSEAGSGAAIATPTGKVLGKFDSSMSGVCQFACATRLKYDPKDLAPQPGAKAEQLTQCPVSGVVFTVDAKRPRVQLGADEYVTCCGSCAAKLRKDPRRFVRT